MKDIIFSLFAGILIASIVWAGCIYGPPYREAAEQQAYFTEHAPLIERIEELDQRMDGFNEITNIVMMEHVYPQLWDDMWAKENTND